MFAKLLKYSLIGFLIIGYPLISHLFLVSFKDSPKVVTLWIALPILAVIVWAFVQWIHTAWPRKGLSMWLVPLLVTMVIAALTYALWPWLTQHNAFTYLVQHVGTNALLAGFFGHTLVKGQTPLITRVASSIHGTLPERLILYTRQITLAWALFFVAVCVVSIVLYFSASLSVWSFFANVMTWPLVGAMFLGEFAVRRYLHSDLTQTSLRQTLTAATNHWRQAPAATHHDPGS